LNRWLKQAVIEQAVTDEVFAKARSVMLDDDEQAAAVFVHSSKKSVRG
jgi:hypothetical protein